MPLFRRIAQRGFSNYPFKKEFAIVNLSDIENKFADGETVDKTSLKAKGLAKSKSLPVKILGNGEITKKVTVVADRVSESAKAKIEKSGGSVTLVEKTKKAQKKD